MPKASDLKRGMVVEVNDEPHVVKNIEVRNPSSRGASTLYKIRFNHLKTKQKRDESLKGDGFLKEVDCERRVLQYSYKDETIEGVKSGASDFINNQKGDYSTSAISHRLSYFGVNDRFDPTNGTEWNFSNKLAGLG